MRLIDADALIKKEERYELDRYIDGERCYEMAVPSCAIIEAPTIDIVHCRECKAHHDVNENPAHIMCGYMSDDDFCSYGEREGE